MGGSAAILDLFELTLWNMWRESKSKNECEGPFYEKIYTPGSVDGATHPSNEGCEGFLRWRAGSVAYLVSERIKGSARVIALDKRWGGIINNKYLCCRNLVRR